MLLEASKNVNAHPRNKIVFFGLIPLRDHTHTKKCCLLLAMPFVDHKKIKIRLLTRLITRHTKHRNYYFCCLKWWTKRFQRLSRFFILSENKRFRRMPDCCDCQSIFDSFIDQIVFLLFLIVYWGFESLMLLIWLSLGIGSAYFASFLCHIITSEKLTNSWETYLTLYILAFGVFLQTTFHIMFWAQALSNVREKASVFYKIFILSPIYILVGVSFYQIFVQFRLRFSAELNYEEENGVTLKFLGAVCFLVYVLGRRCRQDFKMDLARSGIVFVFPGLFKYLLMFGVLGTIETVLLFVWGFPIILLGIIFRYYLFQEHLVYFGLLFFGGLVGFAVSGLERDYTFKGIFGSEPMLYLIHSEVKTNVILFTIAPLMTRWYFRLQFQYPNFVESNKVNFVLFSVNVSFLLMYFVKQVMTYKYRERRDHLRIFVDQFAPNGDNQVDQDNDSISTGSFSGTEGEASSDETNQNFGRKSSNKGGKNNKKNSWTGITTFSVDTQASKGNNSTQINLENEEEEEEEDRNNNNNSTLTFAPLSGSFGIMPIDKRWRDQMLNPGHIQKLCYSDERRVLIPAGLGGSRGSSQTPSIVSWPRNKDSEDKHNSVDDKGV